MIDWSISSSYFSSKGKTRSGIGLFFYFIAAFVVLGFSEAFSIGIDYCFISLFLVVVVFVERISTLLLGHKYTRTGILFFQSCLYDICLYVHSFFLFPIRCSSVVNDANNITDHRRLVTCVDEAGTLRNIKIAMAFIFCGCRMVSKYLI